MKLLTLKIGLPNVNKEREEGRKEGSSQEECQQINVEGIHALERPLFQTRRGKRSVRVTYPLQTTCEPLGTRGAS